MPLVSGNPFFNERIWIFGPPKVGKSTNWANIALNSKLTWGEDPNQPRFWVIDCDRAAARMLLGQTFGPQNPYGHGGLLLARAQPPMTQQEAQFCNPAGNVILYECFTHEDVEKAVDHIMPHLRPGDWVIVDMINYCWGGVQEHYSEYVKGKDLADQQLDALKKAHAAGKQMAGTFTFGDWAGIRTSYNSVVRKLIMRSPCHFLCTSPAEPLTEEDAKKNTAAQQQYGAVGLKPSGVEKNLEYQVRTVLVAKRITHPACPANHVLVSHCDTERAALQQVYGSFGCSVSQVPGQGDFTQQYLVNVAGWRY